MDPSPIRRALIPALALVLLVSSPAVAADWPRHPLREGSHGPAVRALQARVAGWYPGAGRDFFSVDGDFGPMTTRAVRRFQRHFGLKGDGVAGRATFRAFNRLTDNDGSTAHFDWSEFAQHRNPRCSAKANAHAGTFTGGLVARVRVRKKVRLLMWRLEALRAKAGNRPVGINSGFRSVPYNNCIGGASVSQHLYGTAADMRVAEITNRRTRVVARHSQFHGIACYRKQTHNHLDTRMQNSAYRGGRFWWWPERDGRGRELSEDGRPCWGQSNRGVAARRSSDGASRNPSAQEIAEFQRKGEVGDYGGVD